MFRRCRVCVAILVVTIAGCCSCPPTQPIKGPSSPPPVVTQPLTVTTPMGPGPTELAKSELRLDWLREGLTSPSSMAPLLASANITNTGTRAATETVQLYVRLEGTSVSEPVRALKGFQQVTIAPGETRRVVFSITPDAFAFWNDQNVFTVEPSHVTIWIAPDSASGMGAPLEIRSKTNP